MSNDLDITGFGGAPIEGFGLAKPKMEGKPVNYDGKKIRRGRKEPESDYMELRIPRKMSRARIHKLVDQWIDGGRGRTGW